MLNVWNMYCTYMTGCFLGQMLGFIYSSTMVRLWKIQLQYYRSQRKSITLVYRSIVIQICSDIDIHIYIYINIIDLSYSINHSDSISEDSLIPKSIVIYSDRYFPMAQRIGHRTAPPKIRVPPRCTQLTACAQSSRCAGCRTPGDTSRGKRWPWRTYPAVWPWPWP